MTDTIYLDDDISDERAVVQSGGRSWVFDFSRGSLGWYRAYMALMKRTNGVISIGGDEENVEEFYTIAEQVFCPANGDRAALNEVRPGVLLGALRAFAMAWFSGTETLKRIAASQAPNISEMPQPAPATSDTAPMTKPNRQTRRRRSA